MDDTASCMLPHWELSQKLGICPDQESDWQLWVHGMTLSPLSRTGLLFGKLKATATEWGLGREEQARLDVTKR